MANHINIKQSRLNKIMLNGLFILCLVLLSGEVFANSGYTVINAWSANNIILQSNCSNETTVGQCAMPSATLPLLGHQYFWNSTINKFVNVSDSGYQQLTGSPILECCAIEADGLANVSCSGANAITFDLNPTGLDLGASYNVSISNSSASSISPTSGTYGTPTTFTLNDNSHGAGDVLITLQDVDNSYCSHEFTISNNSEIVIAIDNQTINSCATAPDGSVSLSATGGASNTYEYSIDGGTTWQSSPITGLAEGDYTAIARSVGFDCTGTTMFTIGCDNLVLGTIETIVIRNANNNSTGGDDASVLAGPILPAGSHVNANHGSLSRLTSGNIAVLEFDEILPVGLEVTVSIARRPSFSNWVNAIISDGNTAGDVIVDTGDSNILQHKTFTITQPTNQLTVTVMSGLGSVYLDGAEYNDVIAEPGMVCGGCASCSINADGLVNVSCTGTNAISFELNPTSTGIGATYNVSVSGGNATSISPTSVTYGAPTTFTLNDNSAGGGDVTITITDVGDNTCTRDVIVTDPGCCDNDNDGVCNDDDCAPDDPNLPTTPGTTCNDGDSTTFNDVIQANGCDCAGVFSSCISPISDNSPTISSGTCYNNSPNNDASITINNISNADIAGIVLGNDYDTAGGISYNANASTNSNLHAVNLSSLTLGGLASNTTYTIRLFNNNNSCYSDISVQTPTVTCTGVCDIEALISPLVYNDNGTPSILTDDTFTFQVTVTNGSEMTGWASGSTSGQYGDTVNFGPYPVDQGGALIKIIDNSNLNCQVSIGANMNSCVYTNSCVCCED